MKITQGTFSFLPELTDKEITAQIQYALDQGWAVSVEYTDDPHPRNYFWEMWGNPMFDLKDAAGALTEVLAARKAHPTNYIRVMAFDATLGFETTRLSFIVIGHTGRVTTVRRPLRFCCRSWRIDATTRSSFWPDTKDRMDTFFQSNPGLSSRIALHLQLIDCTLFDWMHARA